MRKIPEGTVPSVAHSIAQHNRAAATWGVWLCMSAALQQSISPIAPPMLHDCWLECRGMPATALPATISKSTKHVSRVFMVIATVGKTSKPCQAPVGPEYSDCNESATVFRAAVRYRRKTWNRNQERAKRRLGFIFIP